MSAPAMGRPLEPAQQEAFGAWLGADLSDVRIRTDAVGARWARRLRARRHAGSDVTFATGAYRPDTEDGRRLLAHELAHVVQARQATDGGSHQVSDPAPPAEHEATAAADAWAAGRPAPDLHSAAAPVARQIDDPDDPPAPSPEPDHDVVLQPLDEWSPELAPDDPAVLIAPPGTRRDQIAVRLYGDVTRYGGFDLVGGGRFVLRSFGGVRSDVVAPVRAALDRRLPRDVRAVVDILVQRRIDSAEEWALLNTTVWWASRGDLVDPAGRSYFDAYLDLLDTNRLEEWGLFSNTTLPASEWLVIEAEEKKWAIYPLLGRRSSRRRPLPDVPDDEAPGYTRVTGPITAARRPWNEAQGAVGGYRYAIGEDEFLISSEHTHAGSITVDRLLVDESSASRAEIALRNTDPRFARVMIPGGDGHFYGYRVRIPTFWNADHAPSADPDDPRLHSFWWHYPGTVFIPGGGFQPDFPTGGAPERAQRADLLRRGLQAGLSGLRGLDFDVLTQLSLQQRIDVVGLAAGSSDAADLSLISRVLFTTPAVEFPLLERQLSTNGSMARILNTTESSGGALAVLGRIFTVKAVEAAQVPGENLEALPEFQVGFDSDGFYHYAYPRTSTLASRLVGDIPVGGPVGIGRERAAAGEATGPIQRTAVVLQPAIFRFGGSGAVGFAKNLGRGLASTLVDDNGAPQGPFLPTQLVKVASLGPAKETRVVTVVEAVGILEKSAKSILKEVIATHIQGVTIMAGLGLPRAFGPALAEGLVGGAGARGVAAGLAEAVAGATGRAALMNAAVVAAMEVVEANRAALLASPAGRAFLELYDVTMMIWVGRDVSRLITSGLVPKLAAAADRVIALPGALREAVLPLSTELAALRRAIGRFASPAEAAVAATTGGLALSAQQGARPGFFSMLRVARGEVAAERLLVRIAGTPAETAGRRVVDRLKGLVERSEAEAARAAGSTAEDVEAQKVATARARSAADAQFAVSQRAAQLSPDARDAFLKAVDGVVSARPNSLGSLTDLLVAAASSRTPLSFLTEVQRLVARRGVSDEALMVLGRKVREGRTVLDLPWLNRTSITDDALDFLGREKRTNWDLYRRAAIDPTAGTILRDFRKSARGAAAEMIGAVEAEHLGTGVRRQVRMGSSEIDFEIVVAGRKHGFEIKGWAKDTWDDALDAAVKRLNRKGLSDAERDAVRKIDRMVEQLKDARATTGHRPYLGITDALDDKLRDRLRRVLEAEGLGSTKLVPLSESKIKETAKVTIGQGLGVL